MVKVHLLPASTSATATAAALLLLSAAVCCLTDEERRQYVKLHNIVRQSVVPKAAAMNFVTWSSKLEGLAQKAVDKCVFKHVNRTKYPEYKPYGENIFMTSGKAEPAAVVMAWSIEHKDYTYETKKCRPKQVCGHYTQVATAGVKQIGCGKKKCPSGEIVFCEYDDQNWFYTDGPPCSACPKDRPLCLNGLCISAEIAQTPVAKLFDSTVSLSSLRCRLGCKNCGKIDSSNCNCKCNCGSDGDGHLCEKKKPDSSATCPACPDDPPCLNGGTLSDPSKCKCKCNSDFVGRRCEIDKKIFDSSVMLRVNSSAFVSRSEFNSGIWGNLTTEIANAVNKYCSADVSKRTAQCCNGLSGTGSGAHISSGDVKFVESSIGNAWESTGGNSLHLLVHAKVSDSKLCPAISGSTLLNTEALIGAISDGKSIIDAKLKSKAAELKSVSKAELKDVAESSGYTEADGSVTLENCPPAAKEEGAPKVAADSSAANGSKVLTVLAILLTILAEII